ncbi:hypothetical protein GRJ2_003210800 [Grus japonensis]|uniref:ribonuclease H n=1 Tax=Grus japonensis TaxID=30415 RepID=A0ABC9YCZ0_GRUJA
MKNSPTICQIVVSEALSNIRKTYDAIMLYHYMDDILLAVETESSLSRVFDSLVAELRRYGLQIATEKDWGVEHITGIPRSPTGQAIIEGPYWIPARYVKPAQVKMHTEDEQDDKKHQDDVASGIDQPHN